MKATSVDEICDILGPYWNYTEYAFLECLINELGTRELQEEMKKYIAELEQFEKKTSVRDFNLAAKKKLNLPAHCMKFASS